MTGSLNISGSLFVKDGALTVNDVLSANSRINTTEVRGSSVAIKDANADLMAWFQDGSSRLYSNGYNLRLESNNELNLYNANTAATVHINYHGAGSRVDIANTELDVIKGTGSTFAGNVGIGGSPDTLLNLKDTGGIEVRLEADSNNSGQEDCFIRFYTDGKTQEGIAGMDNNNSSTLFTTNTENAMVFGTVSNLPTVFATNNTERMQIAADGKVGIGTSSPAADLHVSGSGGKILMSDHGQVTLEMQTNDTAAIFQRDLGSTALSGISSGIFMQGKDTSNELTFHVNYGGGSGGNNYNRRLRLTQTVATFDNCNVGIGTDSPGSKLHIIGDAVLQATGATDSVVAQIRCADGNNAATFRTTTSGKVFRIMSQNSGYIYIDSTNPISFLNGGAAQGAQFRYVFAGTTYVSSLSDGNISADSFTDRTPYPETTSLAWDVINSHQKLSEEKYNADDKKHQLDDESLNDYVKVQMTNKDGSNVYGRDLSATVSCLVDVVKDLQKEIKELKS